jgi:hypothetical protein
MIKSCVRIFLVILTLPALGLDSPQQEILDQLFAYKGERTFLLSYPRSGNTWTRYWVEYLTGRPTFHRFNLKDSRNHPIGWQAGFEINPELPPIEKVHTQKEIEKAGGDCAQDKLILIVRNPKEALSRHGGREITCQVLQGDGSKGNSDPRIYFKNIAVYDSWNPEKRLLIFYEDLLAKPIQTIITVLIFLESSFDKIDSFVANYKLHKKNAIKLYKASESKGNDLLYHSKMIAPDHRKQIDAWINELYPHIWQTYLCDKYAEENLSYEE